MDNVNNCGNCMYGKPKNELYVECRRFPPQLANYSHSVREGCFPIISSKDICGEWKNESPGCL